MFVSEEKKNKYISKVHAEMKRRGLSSEEIPAVIGKTGFTMALNSYPEEQLHHDISETVDEILLTAARR